MSVGHARSEGRRPKRSAWPRRHAKGPSRAIPVKGNGRGGRPEGRRSPLRAWLLAAGKQIVRFSRLAALLFAREAVVKAPRLAAGLDDVRLVGDAIHYRLGQ